MNAQLRTIRNIKLTIEYDGSLYYGWQTQPKGITIQSILQTALSKIVNEPVLLTAAGRTDSGVHAFGQVANFKTTSSIPLKNLIQAVNTLLPRDIVVKQANEVNEIFNAQRDAQWRIYQYRILNRSIPSAFEHRYTYFYPHSLNIRSMQIAAKYFLGNHDFSAFNASAKQARHSIRTVKKVSIRRKNDCIIFTIQANGFLHHMVRIIIGTLIDVGRGKIEPNRIQTILQSKQRKLGGMTVPPQGLFLIEVKY